MKESTKYHVGLALVRLPRQEKITLFMSPKITQIIIVYVSSIDAGYQHYQDLNQGKCQVFRRSSYFRNIQGMFPSARIPTADHLGFQAFGVLTVGRRHLVYLPGPLDCFGTIEVEPWGRNEYPEAIQTRRRANQRGQFPNIR